VVRFDLEISDKPNGARHLSKQIHWQLVFVDFFRWGSRNRCLSRLSEGMIGLWLACIGHAQVLSDSLQNFDCHLDLLRWKRQPLENWCLGPSGSSKRFGPDWRQAIERGAFVGRVLARFDTAILGQAIDEQLNVLTRSGDRSGQVRDGQSAFVGNGEKNSLSGTLELTRSIQEARQMAHLLRENLHALLAEVCHI
jgi:hypothetical protein